MTLMFQGHVKSKMQGQTKKLLNFLINVSKFVNICHLRLFCDTTDHINIQQTDYTGGA